MDKNNILLNIHQVLYKRPPCINEKVSLDTLCIYHVLKKLYYSEKGVITWDEDFHENIKMVFREFSVDIKQLEDGFSPFKKMELSVNVDFKKWKRFIENCPVINIGEWRY